MDTGRDAWFQDFQILLNLTARDRASTTRMLFGVRGQATFLFCCSFGGRASQLLQIMMIELSLRYALAWTERGRRERRGRERKRERNKREKEDRERDSALLTAAEN